MSVLARLQRPLNWLADRRLRQLDAVWRDPLRVQDETLRAMVAPARSTVWGRGHGFRGIRSIADYQRRVPVATYLDFKPFVERGIHGGRDVLWPGRPAQYCKTSGTTAGDKYIPVTREAFRMHRQGGLDTLSSRSIESGGRRRSTGPCSSSAAPPGPSPSAGTPRSVTCPAWRRDACPPGSGDATPRAPRSRRSPAGRSA